MITPLLLTQRPGNDEGIEYWRRLMNEKLADFERMNYLVLTRLWLGMENAPLKMWPPIYVMKADIESKFYKWH